MNLVRTDLYHIIRHLTDMEPSNRVIHLVTFHHDMIHKDDFFFKVNFPPGIIKSAKVPVVAGVPVRPSAVCVIRLSHNNVSAVHDTR